MGNDSINFPQKKPEDITPQPTPLEKAKKPKPLEKDKAPAHGTTLLGMKCSPQQYAKFVAQEIQVVLQMIKKDNDRMMKALRAMKAADEGRVSDE